MTRPAFLVDGHMEAEIVRRLCPEAVVRRLNVNGETVRMAAIARAVNLQFRLLGNRNFPVIVLIDRENRPASCGVLLEELKAEMALLRIPLDQFHFGMCDQMIENWIIADHSLIGDRFGRLPRGADGAHGKGELRSFFTPESPYQETTHGVELFVATRASRIADKSPSFANFILNFPIQCHWLAAA